MMLSGYSTRALPGGSARDSGWVKVTDGRTQAPCPGVLGDGDARGEVEVGEGLGVAILGAGEVAAEYVKAFNDHPRTNIIGIYNRTEGKAAALLQAHQVEALEYRSVEQLFDDKRVDIVVSCTRPDARP